MVKKPFSWTPDGPRNQQARPKKLDKQSQRELDHIRGWTKKDDKSRKYRRWAKGLRE